MLSIHSRRDHPVRRLPVAQRDPARHSMIDRSLTRWPLHSSNDELVEWPRSPHLPRYASFSISPDQFHSWILHLRLVPSIRGYGGVQMHSLIDLDPTHSVIRLTVLEESVSLKCAEDCYRHLLVFTSNGGPYAAIYDLSMAKST